LMIL